MNHRIGTRVLCISNEPDDPVIYGILTRFEPVGSSNIPIVLDDNKKEYYVGGIVLKDTPVIRTGLKALNASGIKGEALWDFLSDIRRA